MKAVITHNNDNNFTINLFAQDQFLGRIVVVNEDEIDGDFGVLLVILEAMVENQCSDVIEALLSLGFEIVFDF